MSVKDMRKERTEKLPEIALMRWKQVLKKEVLPTLDVLRSLQVLAINTSESFTCCTFSSLRRGIVMEEHLLPCLPAMDIRIHFCL